MRGNPRIVKIYWLYLFSDDELGAPLPTRLRRCCCSSLERSIRPNFFLIIYCLLFVFDFSRRPIIIRGSSPLSLSPLRGWLATLASAQVPSFSCGLVAGRPPAPLHARWTLLPATADAVDWFQDDSKKGAGRMSGGDNKLRLVADE